MRADAMHVTAQRLTLSDDADEFILAVPGVAGSVVRTGRGSSSMAITSQVAGSATVAMLEFGFPMVGNAEPEGDVLVLCHMLRAPRGGSWNGVGIGEGQTFLYPPGTSQAATDPEGLAFGLVSIPWGDVEVAAGCLGVEVDRDQAVSVRGSDDADPALSGLFASVHGSAGRAGPIRDGALDQDLLLEWVIRTVTHDLAWDGPTTRLATRRGWSSDDLVRDAVDILAMSGRWRMPVLSLCGLLGVSERRLQIAFRSRYQMGPHEFMQRRALQAAHRAFQRGDHRQTTVAAIATEHGFNHGGRFAALYRSTFGESPAATRSRAASAP
jgi:AraC-like DNA-binding protein